MSSFEERMQRWQDQIDAEQQKLHDALITHYARNGLTDAEIRQIGEALRTEIAPMASESYGLMASGLIGPAERMRLRKALDAAHESRR